MRLLPVTVVLLAVSVVQAQKPSTIDPLNLFEDPVPLTDGNGNVLVTGRGQGCPSVVDYNGDGLLDIVLGGKFKAGAGRGLRGSCVVGRSQ